jgi:hypothetical protein
LTGQVDRIVRHATYLRLLKPRSSRHAPESDMAPIAWAHSWAVRHRLFIAFWFVGVLAASGMPTE